MKTINNLHDVVAANDLLISLGGDDQLPVIAARAIERSLELQHRIDRAIDYAQASPPSSVHARNMARILDGSITLDDELNELEGGDGLREVSAPKADRVVARAPKKTKRVGVGRGSYVRPQGLKGRSTKERKEFREWLAEQGIELPQYGPVPQEHVDAFDMAREELRRMRKEGLLSA
jgi:hypothetical protein